MLPGFFGACFASAKFKRQGANVGIDMMGMWTYAFRLFFCLAQMAELVDALASGASGRKAVEVRVLFWAPFLCPRVYLSV